ncbi:MAG: hypothetical protein OEY59_00315 [Deltaproteobacteria bacterium]|nr:hypothetical protein [Deltaproteobacteria bacterium]
MPDYPPVQDLLPQKEAMIFLDKIINHQPGRTSCAARAKRDNPLFDKGSNSLPFAATLEMMAQCAALHNYLNARDSRKPKIGFVVAVKDFLFEAERIEEGERLLITADLVLELGNYYHFDCETFYFDSKTTFAKARVKIYCPEDLFHL